MPGARTHIRLIPTINRIRSNFFSLISSLLRVHMAHFKKRQPTTCTGMFWAPNKKKRRIKVVSHDSLIYSFISFRHTKKAKTKSRRKNRILWRILKSTYNPTILQQVFSYIHFFYLLSYATHTFQRFLRYSVELHMKTKPPMVPHART